MKVRIVCYEDVNKWILGKFALKLCHELRSMSINVDIGKIPDPTADINHHIIYWDYNGEKTTIDTVMVTHIDSIGKLNLLRQQLISAEMGICMSSETMQKLIIAGLPKQKICYISPAHDENFSPKKITIGITSKIHSDGRKNENILVKLSKKIDPRLFRFVIMGKGWIEIVNDMKKQGFDVEYYGDFEYNTYREIVPNFDYFFYFSNDEGSMGYIDALACGVQTIVTPQGFHLDAIDGITYPINNFDDIVQTFNTIAEKKLKLINSVKSWNWRNYALKHIDIWEYLLKNRIESNLKTNMSQYPDGISSLRIEKNERKITWIEKIIVFLTLSKQSIIYFKNNPRLSVIFFKNWLTPILKNVFPILKNYKI